MDDAGKKLQDQIEKMEGRIDVLEHNAGLHYKDRLAMLADLEKLQTEIEKLKHDK